MVFAQNKFGPISRTSKVPFPGPSEEEGEGRASSVWDTGPSRGPLARHVAGRRCGHGIDGRQHREPGTGSAREHIRRSCGRAKVRCPAPNTPIGRPSGAWCAFPRAALRPANTTRTRRKTLLGRGLLNSKRLPYWRGLVFGSASRPYCMRPARAGWQGDRKAPYAGGGPA